MLLSLCDDLTRSADHFGKTFGQVNTLAELGQILGLDAAGNFDDVRLLHAIARMRQAVGQLAVVGQEDQALAVHVEATDREHALPTIGQQIDHARPTRRIAIGADHASRLVDQVVNQLGSRQCDAVDTDFVTQQVGFGAELRDDLAVDLDATGGDQLFALAATAQSSRSQAVFAGAERRRRRPHL